MSLKFPLHTKINLKNLENEANSRKAQNLKLQQTEGYNKCF